MRYIVKLYLIFFVTSCSGIGIDSLFCPELSKCISKKPDLVKIQVEKNAESIKVITNMDNCKMIKLLEYREIQLSVIYADNDMASFKNEAYRLGANSLRILNRGINHSMAEAYLCD